MESILDRVLDGDADIRDAVLCDEKLIKKGIGRKRKKFMKDLEEEESEEELETEEWGDRRLGMYSKEAMEFGEYFKKMKKANPKLSEDSARKMYDNMLKITKKAKEDVEVSEAEFDDETTWKVGFRVEVKYNPDEDDVILKGSTGTAHFPTAVLKKLITTLKAVQKKVV